MLVTFLPSCNGIGHVNRCILLASFFNLKGWDCNIWCLQNIFNKIIKTMPKIYDVQNINCLDLSLPTVNDFVKRNSFSKAFIREASEKLLKSDLIISDNHIESLLVSNKVILSANFFWHQNYTFSNVNDDYSIYCSEIINKFKPYVISSKIFHDRITNDNIRNIMIGLIVSKDSLVFNNENKQTKDSILVSTGLTDNAISEAIYIIQELVNNKIHLKKRIFIEPRLFQYKSWPKEIEKASYTQEMYKSLKYAFIRPGLGTLVNCLSNFVIPICFSEEKNLEMINNKNVIIKNNLGLLSKGFDISFCESNMMDNQIKIIISNIKGINFNGINQFYDAVFKIQNKI